ncbi:Metallo-dependent phosphatase-like protein [Kockovaella imperatae]|uniref:Metallo-dependent phosphatase-like protein n=1 Tax=Kockovaella imperatae TaxID=4999 RepID=A0A1Y1UNB9_9TREE|nr:Metallo-dependent phosphatase-like protein [Kockovaella imperatae]ORX39017.1 Metallo-dependent phosphatase-like protein [Kockovaella imperatae]
MIPGSPRPKPLGSYGAPIGLGHPPIHRGGGRRSGLKSRATQLLALRFGWVVLVVWFEIGEFFHSLSTCKFPDSQLSPSRRSRSSNALNPLPTHIVLLADPHVPHPRLSYHPDSRRWVNRFRQALDELFMRKSWNVVMRLGRVDGVIVLGDMLDWGRGNMSDQEYEEYVKLYRSIFTLPPDTPMYFIPGNHDIPLGPGNKLFSTSARERYAKYFSPPNSILEVANHTLILLDAVGLVEEDYRRYAAEMQFGEWDGVEGGVIEFVKTLGETPPIGPKILLSHIPLARPEKASCGPLREHGRIAKGAGPGYQNLLGRETSQFLLEELQPSLVLSGDDHDYCDFTHQPFGIREVTVKSFSSTSGIRRPGFQVLSLIPPSPSSPYTEQVTIADRPCFLPDQGGVYGRVYLPLAILTVCYLIGSNFWAAWERWNASGHTVYGDLKARLSPALMSSDQLQSQQLSRRVSDRPSPLALSRRSSRDAGLPPAYGSPNQRGSFSRSAPVSPSSSPRLTPRFHGHTRDDDEESSIYDVSGSGTLSRSPSYGQARFPSDPYLTPALSSNGFTAEPSSYFLPLPDESSGRPNGVGLGLSPSLYPLSPAFSHTPTERRSIKRSSSANFSIYPSSKAPISQLSRLIPSAFDISAAAKAKEKSVLGYMVDSLPLGSGFSPRRGDKLGAVKGFVKVAIKSRTGLIGKSLNEVLAVAWPTALVWLIVNVLFFLG